jgi:26S proteasome regulatory subunit T1
MSKKEEKENKTDA